MRSLSLVSQDDTGHGLTLNGLYREDVMSQGGVEDYLDNPFFQYQPPTAPLQPERINSDLGSGPSASTDFIKLFRDPRYCEVTEGVLGAIVGPPPQRDHTLIQFKEAGIALARKVIHPKEPWP